MATMHFVPTYDECVRMSKSIPKLRIEADWEEWYSALRIVLGTISYYIWDFIEGRYYGPTPLKETDDIIRHIALLENKALEEITNVQVAAYEQAAASDRGWWLPLIGRAWFLLWCTLGTQTPSASLASEQRQKRNRAAACVAQELALAGELFSVDSLDLDSIQRGSERCGVCHQMAEGIGRH
jgi:hypothetical protein